MQVTDMCKNVPIKKDAFDKKNKKLKGCSPGGGGGGDFDDLYPDVCVEGLKKDPF